MREGDKFTLTMVDRLRLNSYDLQVIVEKLTDRGITLTTTAQAISTKD